METFVAAERVRLSDRVTEELTRMLAAGRLKPGDVLPSESELARRFGVSKPVVREALNRLSARGVVVVQQGKQTSVAALSSVPLASYFELAVRLADDGLREAIQLRSVLEPEIAALAAARIDDDALDALAALIERLKALVETQDPWVEADLEFHLAIARASGNRIMQFLMEALAGTIRENIRLLQRQRDLRDARATLRRHLAIYEALRARDPAAARAAMQKHFASQRRVVEAILRDPARSRG
jgi:GntR family transcriptional regulator, transcriptional repressor for pyruvate dehydrogenase complex